MDEIDGGPYLCEMRMRATYDKFVKVLGLSIKQFCNSYYSEVLAVTFYGRHIQVIIWVSADDTICKLKGKMYNVKALQVLQINK